MQAVHGEAAGFGQWLRGAWQALARPVHTLRGSGGVPAARRLAPGESLVLRIERPLQLVVEAGSVQVSGASQWVADSMLQITARVAGGESTRVQAGWITVRALAPVRIRFER